MEEKKQILRKYIIIMGIALGLVFVLTMISIALKNVKSNREPVEYSSISTVKEVVEYYESQYISQDYSDEPGYYIDIDVVFKVPPYIEEKEEVNREYYEKLLKDIARIISYKSYIIKDSQKNITIKVICKEGRFDRIILNDIEDYFTYVESMISSKHYQKIDNVKLSVTSDLLNDVIQNNWDSSYDFGQKDSLFNKYNNYLSQGIKVRTLQNKIYNIIFTKNYDGDVIGNLTASSDIDQVKRSLGDPSFEDEELGVVGYKSKELYVFFGKGEISVYRVFSGNTDDFFNLVDKYLVENYKPDDLLKFMNELTYMWKDYAVYDYTGSQVYLSYPHKGVEVKINFENESGLIIYNNIASDLTLVKNKIESTKYISRLQQDCIFEIEKRRRKDNIEFNEKVEEYTKEIYSDGKHGESLTYKLYAESGSNGNISSIKFISDDPNFPDRELNDTVLDFIWEDNTHFIYTKSKDECLSIDMENGFVSGGLKGGYIEGIRNGEED